MKRLWIFGDNNSAIFGKTIERRFKYYKEYRGGNFPSTWSELLAKSLNLQLKNLAVKGQSNYDIFEMFCRCAEQIQKGDIVMIGWGYVHRFRLVDESTNSFISIRPNQFKEHHINIPTMLNGIDLHTIDSILDNRRNLEWCNEIINWEILINLLSKHIGFKVFYWSFDETINKPHYISTKDFRNYLISIGAEDFTLETNGVLNDDNFGEKGQIVQFEYFLNHLKNE